jgi:hypothetical protein
VGDFLEVDVAEYQFVVGGVDDCGLSEQANTLVVDWERKGRSTVGCVPSVTYSNKVFLKSI